MYTMSLANVHEKHIRACIQGLFNAAVPKIAVSAVVQVEVVVIVPPPPSEVLSGICTGILANVQKDNEADYLHGETTPHSYPHTCAPGLGVESLS